VERCRRLNRYRAAHAATLLILSLCRYSAIYRPLLLTNKAAWSVLRNCRRSFTLLACIVRALRSITELLCVLICRRVRVSVIQPDVTPGARGAVSRSWRERRAAWRTLALLSYLLTWRHIQRQAWFSLLLSGLAGRWRKKKIQLAYLSLGIRHYNCIRRRLTVRAAQRRPARWKV